MKKLLSFFLLLLGCLARAEMGTNYADFSFKFIPQLSLTNGPHSSLPYAPSLTLLTYETDLGVITESLTNNAAPLDLSTIATPFLSVTVSQPLFNSMQFGTNPVVFGRFELKGELLPDSDRAGRSHPASGRLDPVSGWKAPGG